MTMAELRRGKVVGERPSRSPSNSSIDDVPLSFSRFLWRHAFVPLLYNNTVIQELTSPPPPFPRYSLYERKGRAGSDVFRARLDLSAARKTRSEIYLFVYGYEYFVQNVGRANSGPEADDTAWCRSAIPRCTHAESILPDYFGRVCGHARSRAPLELK